MDFFICGYPHSTFARFCDFLLFFFNSSDAVFDDLKITINSLCRSDAISILNGLS